MITSLRRTLAHTVAVLGLCLSLMPADGWSQEAEAQATDEEPGFRVLFSEAREVDQVIRLDAGFDLKLSPELIEAITKGIPITIDIEMELWRSRSYWLDDEVARVVQSYTLTYNDLTRSYILENLNSGAHFKLPTLDSALWVASGLTDFPFVDASLLQPQEQYYYRIRLGVNVESLPVPLRVLAFVSSRWHLTSEWYTWPLTR